MYIRNANSSNTKSNVLIDEDEGRNLKEYLKSTKIISSCRQSV